MKWPTWRLETVSPLSFSLCDFKASAKVAEDPTRGNYFYFERSVLTCSAHCGRWTHTLSLCALLCAPSLSSGIRGQQKTLHKCKTSRGSCGIFIFIILFWILLVSVLHCDFRHTGTQQRKVLQFKSYRPCPALCYYRCLYWSSNGIVARRVAPEQVV